MSELFVFVWPASVVDLKGIQKLKEAESLNRIPQPRQNRLVSQPLHKIVPQQ